MEIIWEYESASDIEVNAKKVARIREYRSNDPDIGYNQWTKPPLGSWNIGEQIG